MSIPNFTSPPFCIPMVPLLFKALTCSYDADAQAKFLSYKQETPTENKYPRRGKASRRRPFLALDPLR
ncbi:MAG: hypothetical protein RR218_02545, partial [Gordonibacter sp.]